MPYMQPKGILIYIYICNIRADANIGPSVIFGNKGHMMNTKSPSHSDDHRNHGGHILQGGPQSRSL